MHECHLRAVVAGVQKNGYITHVFKQSLTFNLGVGCADNRLNLSPPPNRNP